MIVDYLKLGPANLKKQNFSSDFIRRLIKSTLNKKTTIIITIFLLVAGGVGFLLLRPGSSVTVMNRQVLAAQDSQDGHF